MIDLISNAYAADAGAQAASGGPAALLMPLIFLAIFYFLLWRPQSKRAKEQREMVNSVQKGDEVVTSGGLLGRVTDAGEKYLGLHIAENVTIKVQRSAINTVLPKGTIKSIN